MSRCPYWKESGNESFRAGNYKEAIQAYSNAFGRFRAPTQNSILLFYPTGPPRFSPSILIKWPEKTLSMPCSSCLTTKKLDIVCRWLYFTYVPTNLPWMNFDLLRAPPMQMSKLFFDHLSNVSWRTVMGNMTSRREGKRQKIIHVSHMPITVRLYRGLAEWHWRKRGSRNICHERYSRRNIACCGDSCRLRLLRWDPRTTRIHSIP